MKIIPLGESMDELLVLVFNCLFAYVAKFESVLFSELGSFENVFLYIFKNCHVFPNSLKAILALIWELTESQQNDDFDCGSQKFSGLVNAFLLKIQDHLFAFLKFSSEDQMLLNEEYEKPSPFDFLSSKNPSLLIDQEMLSFDETPSKSEELIQNDNEDLWNSEQLWYLSQDYTKRYFAINIMEKAIENNQDLHTQLSSKIFPVLSSSNVDYIVLEQHLKLFIVLFKEEQRDNSNIQFGGILVNLCSLLSKIDQNKELLFVSQTLYESILILLKLLKESQSPNFTSNFQEFSQYLCGSLQNNINQYQNFQKIKIVSECLKELISTFYAEFIPIYKAFALSFLNSEISRNISQLTNYPKERSLYLQNSLDILCTLEKEVSNPDLPFLLPDSEELENLKIIRESLKENYAFFLNQAINFVPESTLQVLSILQASPKLNALPLLPLLFSSFQKCVNLFLLPIKRRPCKVNEYHLSELLTSFLTWLTIILENGFFEKSKFICFISMTPQLLNSKSFHIRALLYSLFAECICPELSASFPFSQIVSKCIDDLFYSGLDFDSEQHNLALANNVAFFLGELITAFPQLFSSAFLKRIVSKASTIFRKEKHLNKTLAFSLTHMVVQTLSLDPSAFLMNIRFIFKFVCASLALYTSTSETGKIIQDCVSLMKFTFGFFVNNEKYLSEELDETAFSFFFVMIANNFDRFSFQIKELFERVVPSENLSLLFYNDLFKANVAKLPADTQDKIKQILIK